MSRQPLTEAVAMIRDGARLHYEGEPDDDSLLRGDRRYAEGLVALAALGDLNAVARLADVIARVAQAHAEGDPARAQAAWEGLASDGSRDVDDTLARALN